MQINNSLTTTWGPFSFNPPPTPDRGSGWSAPALMNMQRRTSGTKLFIRLAYNRRPMSLDGCGSFSARDSTKQSALCNMLLNLRPSVCLCPSFCPSHGWIRQKRLKLAFVAPSLLFSRDKFHPEILTGSFWTGATNKVGWGKQAIFKLCASISRKRYEIGTKIDDLELAISSGVWDALVLLPTV